MKKAMMAMAAAILLVACDGGPASPTGPAAVATETVLRGDSGDGQGDITPAGAPAMRSDA